MLHCHFSDRCSAYFNSKNVSQTFWKVIKRFLINQLTILHQSRHICSSVTTRDTLVNININLFATLVEFNKLSSQLYECHSPILGIIRLPAPDPNLGCSVKFLEILQLRVSLRCLNPNIHPPSILTTILLPDKPYQFIYIQHAISLFIMVHIIQFP